ncbi:MAG: DinB family protein [Caldilineaceae bacterium]|nr:DinB family protein [Caldilineaceae bacterium]MBP8109613.1 DinB family protein [Caldilineaceae bacterium]MBP8124497.1 DinB family protein [Caldilineaceae bacterium]MBP9074174.1 DinB family protein [Caldilineaceae bacterium]
MTDTTHDPPIKSGLDHAQALRSRYDSLIRTLGLLTPAELATARLPAGWTPTALLAHVAYWDHIQTERMMAALAGPEAQAIAPWPTTDNNARAAADEGREWAEVLAQADAARQRMIDFAAGLSPQILAATYPEPTRTLSINTLLTHMADHVREHANEVMNFCGSLDRWGRAGMRRFLAQQHANLMDAIGSMAEAWLVSEPVEGKWTCRDVLTHVLCWEEFAWAVIQNWPETDDVDLSHWLVAGEDGDATNARLMAEKIDFTMIDLVDWLTTFHRRTLRTFDKLSDEQVRTQAYTGFGRDSFTGFLYSMSMHTADHAALIWRARPDARFSATSRQGPVDLDDEL